MMEKEGRGPEEEEVWQKRRSRITKSGEKSGYKIWELLGVNNYLPFCYQATIWVQNALNVPSKFLFAMMDQLLLPGMKQ